MSGFIAIWQKDGRPIDQAWLPPVMTALSERGRDGQATWVQGDVALGTTLLRTAPGATAEQLLAVDGTGRLRLAGEFRIDNRRDLYRRLNLPLAPATADGQLILHAYRRWGQACPAHLIGDFAFVIWDAKQRHFFGARDPMSTKPFFYLNQPDRLVCASALGPILALPDVPQRLNELHVGAFLVRDFSNRTATFYQDLLRLPGCHLLLATDDSARTWAYWEPDYDRKLPYKSSREYADAFAEAFTSAVRSRVNSAASVGSTLSGGLDSSSVAATAARILEQESTDVQTFSAIFPRLAEVDPRIDERAYIDRMLDAFPFVPHLIEADALNPMVADYWEGDEPLLGINFYLDHAFGETGRRHGVNVLLTGHDGDSVVSHGYELFPFLLRRGRFFELYRVSRATAQLYRRSVRNIVLNYALLPFWNGWLNRPRVPETGRFLAEFAVNPAFARRIGLVDYLYEQTANESVSSQTGPRSHWQGLVSGEFSYGTETLDRVLSRYGIEPRHPFLDRNLIELCLALPLEQRFSNGWNRVIVRRAMADTLPRAVCWRKEKANLSASFQTNLLEMNRPILNHMPDRVRSEQEFIDGDAFVALFRRYREDPLHRGAEAMTVQTVTTLFSWLEMRKMV